MGPRYCDYYKTLGVARTASADEIRDAFRRLARKYHPDVNPGKKGAEDKFKAISEAYEVLSDPTKRRHYDALGNQWKAGQEFVPPRGWAGAARAEKPRGGFSEFFNSLFGGGFEGLFNRPDTVADSPEPAPRRGADIEIETTIPLEQAFRGTRTTVALRMPEPARGGSPRSTLRKLEVKIPAGIHNGARIRLAGQGRPADAGGAPPGDLFIRVHIAPHAVFRTRGSDVEMDLAISPWEAALGAKISVPTLDGQVEMSLPAASQSGQRLRLRGRGMPKGGGERGDQYVVLKIVVPEVLSDRERELFEQMAHDSPFKPR